MADKNVHWFFLQGLSATQLSDPQEIVNAFKQAEQAELVGVREVRERNLIEYNIKYISLEVRARNSISENQK